MRFAFICLFLALLLSWSGSALAVTNSLHKTLPPDAAPPAQQVFRYLLEEPVSYDVGVAFYAAQGALPLFERLAMLDENLALVPGAAMRWVVSKDGRAWTFHLRPGARWSDGRPVIARDFEYAYKRFLNPAEASSYAFLYYEIKGARAFNQGQTKNPDTVGVRAVDDMTLLIETEKPCPYLPYITAFASSAPVPSWQVEKYGRKWSEPKTFVSNSSYILSAWEKGRQAILSLNPRYNGPYPGYLEKIIQIFTTGNMGTAPYENGEVDVTGVSVTDLPRLERHPTLRSELVRFSYPETRYLFFRTRQPPFDNLKVRQAISHAIDREALCRVALRGLATPAYTMLPSGFPGSAEDESGTIQAYDPDLARRLLKEAGYPNGAGFPTLDLWLGFTNQDWMLLAQAVQAMLKSNLGISVNVKATGWQLFMDNMFQWQIPMGLGVFNADYPDPNNLLAMLWRSQPVDYGRHDWRHPEFDRLVDAASYELGHEKRMELYRKADRLLAEDVGAVFILHPLTAELRKPWLKGIPVNKRGDPILTLFGLEHTRVYIGKH